MGQVPSGVRSYLWRDDFADGDFTRSPTWQHRGGTVWVDEQKRLRSRVAAVGQGQAGRSVSQEDLPLVIIGAILGQGLGGNSDRTSPSGTTDRAHVELAQSIPGNFRVRTTLIAYEPRGQFQISLLGARELEHRALRVTLDNRQMRVAIIGGDGTVLAQSAVTTRSNTPSLDGLEWRQDTTGIMTVTLDGTRILSKTLPRSAAGYNSLRLSNFLGDFAVDYVEVGRT